MNLQWHEWVALIVVLILLLGPGICFWLAGYMWEKPNKNESEEAHEQTKTFDGCSYRGNCLTDCTYRAECPYYSLKKRSDYG